MEPAQLLGEAARDALRDDESSSDSGSRDGAQPPRAASLPRPAEPQEPDVEPVNLSAVQPPGRSSLPGFGLALLAVLAALAVRLTLTPLLGDSSPFLLFIPAVLLATRYGGAWPGLFATALSSALGVRYVLSGLAEPSLEKWDRIGLFLAVCLIIVWVQSRLAAASQRIARSLDNERGARREAQAANRAKDEFLAMVSHELRTPANTVLGWMSVLRREHLESPIVRKGLEVIERNVSLQARLLEDIVDNLRASKGTMRLQRQTIDLASVVTAAVDTARPAATRQDVRLDLTLESREMPVFGDPVRLQQVMTNLISNALKFTPARGSIAVRLERTGDLAKVSVTDTGVGIDPDFLPYVFERFKRGDHSREGLGLGLAISRHLVEMHGGTIEAASAGPARGSTFTVALPIQTRE